MIAINKHSSNSDNYRKKVWSFKTPNASYTEPKYIVLKSSIIIFLLSFGTKGITQETSYSISLEAPLFYKNYQKHNTWKLYFVNFELLLKSRSDLYHSFKIGSGIGPLEAISSAGAIPLSYSIGKRQKNHFFEVGSGIVLTHPFFYLNLRLGYRYYLGSRLILQFAYTPSVWAGGGFFGFDGGSYNKTFHGLNVGIGYHIKPLKRQFKRDIIKRFYSVQFVFNPISYNLNNKITHTEVFRLDYSLIERGNYKLFFNIGLGSIGFNYPISGRAIIMPIGLNYMYGKTNHFFETNLLLYSYGYSPYKRKNYKTLQPQLGYRYNFNKPFFVRVAYAPYFRMADWKFRDGMEQSMVFGFGYRFR